MGLQGRLLAGLAVLVFLAIGSTGWLTVQVARAGLDATEEERARGLGEAAAILIGRAGSAAGAQANAPPSARDEAVAQTARALVGLGGVTDVVVVDAGGRVVVGADARDPSLQVALRGGAAISRREGALLSVYAPVHAEPGAVQPWTGAVRVRVAVGANLDEAVGGSTRLLAAVTTFDGALILIFGALFVRSVVRPLGQVSRAAQRVAEGDLDGPPLARSAGEAQGEVGALADSFDRMTAALREQRRNLEASREQVLAQEKLATVGRLAAGVAHEIGNPLTAVLGYLEILIQDLPPADASPVAGRTPPMRELLERVRGETTRIQQIVHDLIEYARPVAEVVEPVDLAEVVTSAIALCKPQPRFRDVIVEAALDGAPLAAASARRLLQVILNLLLNAADAMGGSGAVRISSASDGARVTLTVTDSGRGVAEADRERIFDPFFTTKEPGRGTGLGLAVCRSLLQAYGGEIALAPSETGASFRITLPIWKG